MLDLTVHFDFDSATIRAESKKPLQDLAQALQDGRLSSFRFQVEGHTDAQGTAAYNDSLSERRAQAVVGFLSSEGVGTERLQPVGKGFRELLDTADPKSAKNRRVRILTQP
jgi:outer membrane protein OmpA-like peptidoglycan-associated protein